MVRRGGGQTCGIKSRSQRRARRPKHDARRVPPGTLAVVAVSKYNCTFVGAQTRVTAWVILWKAGENCLPMGSPPNRDLQFLEDQ